MDTYELVRRAVIIEDMSKREASRIFGVNRRTVAKMAKHSVPPGYRLSFPRKQPRMEGFRDIIDEILRLDETAPRKQRHKVRTCV